MMVLQCVSERRLCRYVEEKREPKRACVYHTHWYRGEIGEMHEKEGKFVPVVSAFVPNWKFIFEISTANFFFVIVDYHTYMAATFKRDFLEFLFKNG